MLFNRFIHGAIIFLLSILGLFGEPNQFPESAGLSSLEERGFFAGLTKGDNRKVFWRSYKAGDSWDIKNYSPI